MHSICRDYFNQHREKKDNFEDKFDIPLATPNTTQTNDIFEKFLKQPSNSPFMHVSKQDIGQLNNENPKRKLVLNLENQKNTKNGV